MFADWKEEEEGETIYLLHMLYNTGRYSDWSDRGCIRSDSNK